MEIKDSRIPSLDGLRAISIILVVVSHFLNDLAWQHYNIGNLGVRIFFVISGFLITGLLLGEQEKKGAIDLKHFYFRRTLRIFPPYYFYLLILLALAIFGLMEVPMRGFLYSFFYLSNYFNTFDAAYADAWSLGHTWSLSVEEQFYLILPGILFLFGFRRAKYFLLAILFLAPLIRLLDFQIFNDSRFWVGRGFHHYMDALGAGCLLALFRDYLDKKELYLKLLRSKFIFLCPFIIIIFNIQYDHPKFIFFFGYSAINLLIAFCIDWSVKNHESIFGRFLNSRPVSAIGLMSYSIYLWQQPFFNHASDSILASFPYNFIGMAVMSLFSYYFIEKYSLKFRKRIESSLFKRAGNKSLEASLSGA